MLSFPTNIPTILHAIKQSGAKRILDVGGGMGKYALLIREQHISIKAEQGELSPIDEMIIDCCEDTEYFVNKAHHNALYDNHYHDSVFNMKFPNDYDLILFIDTVEHWDKEETKELLSKLNGKKLISTPKNTVMYTQHFYGDSRHHKSQWNKEDFAGRDYSTNESYIFVE